MDSRNPGQHPWSRPLSQPTARDSRQAPNPIPPPPYNMQTSAAPASAPRPQTFFNNDLFLSRKNERGNPTRETNSQQQPMYASSSGHIGLQQYATSVPREALGPGSRQEREQEQQGTWTRFTDGRDDRYDRQAVEAPSALPPPPPSTAYRPSLEALHITEALSRQAGPRSSSPRMYGAAQSSLPPPPPPPTLPYGSRHMRPPSSPQYGASPSNRDPPPPSPHSGGRDLPALPANTRPGSSMSIMSLLGTDPRPSRETLPTTSYGNGPQSTGTYNSLMQYSTSAASPTKPSIGNGSEHRDSSTTQSAMSGVLNRPFRAYSGGSAGTSKRSSPSANALRFGVLPAESTSFAPISLRPGQQETAPDHNRQANAGGIHRPNSQPMSYNASHLDFERKARDIDARRAELAREEELIARNGFSNRSRSSTFDVLGRPARAERQESSTQPTPPTSQGGPHDDRTQTTAYPFLSNSSVFNEPTRSKPEYSYTPRGERLAAEEQDTQNHARKSPFDADALRRLREERLGATGMQQQPQDLSRASTARPRFPDNLENPPAPMDARRLSSASVMQRTRSIDSVGQSRNSEELSNHRHSLAVMLDANKRGRVSPLPQAVQGAQGRTNGPSRDPSIKNEFSRMFAGIGSGVSSSGLAGSGTSTPFPPSPRPSVENGQQIPFGPPNDIVKVTESRNGSRMGKRRSRMKEDEVKEIENGTVTGASADGRGIKRAKHSHRHHIHAHHHRRDEETPLRAVTNPNSSTPAPHHRHHAHHHHHADGTIHHHHTHTKQAAPVPEKAAPPPRMPATLINNTAILSATQNLPRRHLGSHVYAPNIPTATSTASLNPKLSYTSGQYTIPRCDGKENCTLTIRVPRFYLTHSSLLQTTTRAAVWGTDIYTDDSDPLCAAIHAGWIRGAWPDHVDINMIEPNLKNVNLSANAVDYKDTTFTAPPADSPMMVPQGKDMHLTLVILPALQSYASRVIHGVKSRTWGNDHDGMSFKIQKMAFIDEGSGRGEEKKAAVRRQRLDALTEGSKENLPPITLRLEKLTKPAMRNSLKAAEPVVAAA